MSDKTKQQLKIENNSSFPNNNTGFITPEKLRTFNENVIDSFLENDYTASNDATIADLSGSFNDFTQSYYVDSASFDSRISAVDTSSYVEQTQFDSFATQSNQQLNSLEQFTASIDDDFVSETELAAATASLINQINTKADQTDFTAYTSSNDSRVSSIENTTSSLETKFATLASTTSSLNTFTASAEQQLNSLENNTGSYARTDTTNQFQQTQTLEQDLIVEGNLYVSGAEVIISSSELVVGDRIIEVNANKVIGDAGLYAFDAIGDQTGSLIWNPTLDYWLAGLSGSEEKVLVSSDTGSIQNSITQLDLFTQSAEGRLDNIEQTTASLESSITQLNTATSSLENSVGELNSFTASQEDLNGTFATTQSLNEYTESADNRLDNIEQTTSSLENSVGELNSFTASQEDLNTTFATTGSNTFTDNQVVSGSITLAQGNDFFFGQNTNGLQITSFDSLDQDFFGFDTSFGIVRQGHLNQTPLQNSIALGAFALGEQQAQSGSLISSTIAIGSQALTRTEDGVENTAIGDFALGFHKTGSLNTAIGPRALFAIGFGTTTPSDGNVAIGQNCAQNAIGGFLIEGNDNTYIGRGIRAGATQVNNEIVIGAFAEGHGENTTTLGSIDNTQETYILGNTFISGSNGTSGDLDIQGTFTSSLTEGFVLVGDGNNRTYEVSTGSFGGGGSTDITALNNFTASQEDLNSTFATTGSNTFNGNQTFQNADSIVMNVDTGSFNIPFLTFNTTKFTIQDTSGLDFVSQANVTFESIANNIQFLGDAQFNNKATINEVLNLQGQDPLPSGNIGDLAVSGSNLYFYDGAWKQVSLV